MLLEHVRSTCPCFTGLLQYSHEKGEKGGSLSFKFNLVDPEGNKLIDQSFFISVLGRHPPPTPAATTTTTTHPVTCCTPIKAQMVFFIEERRRQLLQIYPFVLRAC